MKHFILSLLVLAVAKATTFGREFFIAAEIGFSAEWDRALIIIATVGVALDAFVYYCNAHRFASLFSRVSKRTTIVLEAVATLAFLNAIIFATHASGFLQLDYLYEFALANVLCVSLMQVETSRLNAISSGRPQLVSSAALVAAITSVIILLVFDVTRTADVLLLFIAQSMISALTVRLRLYFARERGINRPSEEVRLHHRPQLRPARIVFESLMVAATGQGQRYIERILLLSLFAGALSVTHLLSTVVASVISIVSVTIINFTMRRTFSRPDGNLWFISAVSNTIALMIVFGTLRCVYELSTSYWGPVELARFGLVEYGSSFELVESIFALVASIALIETTNAIVKRVAWANGVSLELAITGLGILAIYTFIAFSVVSLGSIYSVLMASVAYQIVMLSANLLILIKCGAIHVRHAVLLIVSVLSGALAWIALEEHIITALFIAFTSVIFAFFIIVKERNLGVT